MTDRTFEPTTLGAIPLANRLVMAPMTRNRATPSGEASPSMARYYAQRASAGMIISEGTQPSQVGQGFMNTPGLHTPRQVAAWREVTQAVHLAGGRIVAQLMHAGRVGHPSLYATAHQSVGPSALAPAGQAHTPSGPQPYPVPRALSLAEIEQTCRDFAQAAVNARDAGFDGVEVHAGNGFLLHQFMAQNCNTREDGYGGSVANRVRFTLDVLHAVSAAIGADRTGVRISPGNPYNDIQEGDTELLYRALVPQLPALAYLHVMEAGNRAQTQDIRRHWSGALILNPHADANSWPTAPQSIEPVLREGLADAVSLGALFLANPDLVSRLRRPAPLNAADPDTYYAGGDRGYTDYPVLQE
ncbi:alkene reductase [Verminephrobacter aporrectodeae subsp. tuberculatae]|uniref:Alkene reductase n=1 Tax=Verminephrobacter aporrectodeae subsp. tuberculatae TaxID=1110392 RepID=A0ABT3KRT3_9BURK|nr:alkene reductase [Verminephrobacter aporrectodeae]MCW5321021.1 alkene reductase [Verminephrobacter aporrectodeae subsp. tuberculatae]